MAHPLLPSKAVHDPIAKLVAAAGTHVRRLEGAGGGGSPAGVQANLARLLGEIWRKLREESALLDFFLRADESGGLRLGVFDKLLPLLELRGRTGQQAQEACLVALSVKDARVGRYVRDRTGLAAQLAGTLTARYLALYDTLKELEVAAALPPPAGAGRDEAGAGRIAGLLTQQQPERAEATFTEALTLFLQHLRFCNAVGMVAADTQACLRPPSALTVSSPGGGGGGGSGGTATADQTGISPTTDLFYPAASRSFFFCFSGRVALARLCMIPEVWLLHEVSLTEFSRVVLRCSVLDQSTTAHRLKFLRSAPDLRIPITSKRTQSSLSHHYLTSYLGLLCSPNHGARCGDRPVSCDHSH